MHNKRWVFFKKACGVCVCVYMLCDFFFLILEISHHKDLTLGSELNLPAQGSQVSWLWHWFQAPWCPWEANIKDRKWKAKTKKDEEEEFPGGAVG